MVYGQRPLDLELEPNSKFSEKGLPYICCASCCIHGLSSLIGTYSKGGVKYEGCRIPVGFRVRHPTGPFPVSPVPALAGEVIHRYRL